jgi:hypothetical protein
MTNKELIQFEITELNKRYIYMCLRVQEENLNELSVQLNTPMSILKMLRCLDYEQIEKLISESRFFLQPAIELKSLEKAAQINSDEIRTLFISSSIKLKNA